MIRHLLDSLTGSGATSAMDSPLLATHLQDHVLELECIITPAAAITRSRTISVPRVHKLTGAGAVNVSHCGFPAAGPLGVLSLLLARMIQRALAIMRSTSSRINVALGEATIDRLGPRNLLMGRLLGGLRFCFFSVDRAVLQMPVFHVQRSF